MMACSVTIFSCHQCKKPFPWQPGPNPDYRPGNGHMICGECCKQYEIDCEREEQMFEWYCRSEEA